MFHSKKKSHIDFEKHDGKQMMTFLFLGELSL